VLNSNLRCNIQSQLANCRRITSELNHSSRVALDFTALERFQAKGISVRLKKTRQNKMLKPGSDSIRTTLVTALTLH
jgi:hypothetical protein